MPAHVQDRQASSNIELKSSCNLKSTTMNSKLRSILMAMLPVAFIATSCQDNVGIDDSDASGSAAAVTVGNGTRLVITTPQHWTSGTYILDGEVVIDGTTLTIDAGVIVKGKKDTTPADGDPLNSSLIIDRDAQIFVNGTSSSPVVFTSDQAAGARNPGDWGGVVILGPDVVNQANPQIEGFDNPLPYGGTGDTRPQGSGVITYARFEFSGTILADGNETNGLTLAGVHSNTTINHIQISRGNDDGLEIFGGTVNVKFVVVWQTRDDDFDTDFGHTGVIQYAIGRRLNTFVSTESNGIETDNNATGSTATPETRTLFANLTLIGPATLTGDGSGIDLTAPNVFNGAMLVRRNSSTNVWNSLFTAWPTGTNVRDQLTAQNGVGSSRTLNLVGITYGQPYTGGTYLLIDPAISGALNTAFTSQYNLAASANNEVATVSGGTNAAAAVGLKNAAFNDGTTAPDFTAATVLSSVATVPAGVTAESFRGASDTDGTFNGGSWNFTAGWLNFNPANAVYPN
jgi:hypothetical protein